jgi:ribosomal protein S6
MTNLQYETLILAPTEITEDEISTIESLFDKVCSQAQGKLANFDKWGKFQLAYPVKKNSYGVYILARYELPKDSVSEALSSINTFIRLKCGDFIMRHMNIKLDRVAASTYFKPDALDASNTGNMQTFIEENKIGNLLDSVDASDDYDRDDR